MAMAAIGPVAVRSVEELPADESNRFNAVWLKMEQSLQQDGAIPRANQQAVLQAAARSVQDFALQRGFHSAQVAEEKIEVFLAPKVIVQEAETLTSVVKKALVGALFGSLGWNLAKAVHPAVGFGIGAAGLIANSDSSKERIQNYCQ